MKRESAIVLAPGPFDTLYAKPAHGLVRHSERYRIVALVDPAWAGRDAGEVLDGRPREIPIFESVGKTLGHLGTTPQICIIGLASAGGALPPELRTNLTEALAAGLSVVNPMHQLLGDDGELSRIAASTGSRIVDLRRSRPAEDLRFWSGECLKIPVPVVPVLGTDCALGKRTAALLVRDGCRAQGIRAEMIYTGQTGCLQGVEHGFILDATPNDFVSGELERSILECYRDKAPDLILIEGQASLRNPSGPCGSELIVSTGASGVILQHAPGRKHFLEKEGLGLVIPPLEEEIEIIRLLGAEVWAVTLSDEGLDRGEAVAAAKLVRESLGIPAAFALADGIDEVVDAIVAKIAF